MLFISLFHKLGISKPIKLVSRTCTTSKNPFTRTWDILTNDIRKKKTEYYPEHTDIVIIGGGFIGSAVAYALKLRAGPGLSVVVLDKDATLKNDQRNIVLGTLSQHFSLPENICLAQYSAEFFRNIKQHLFNDIDIQYHPYGRLILASEKYAEQLEKNVSIQREHGMKNELLSVEQIQKKYPWIDTSGIKLGCISTECDGLFNASVYLNATIEKSKELGANHVHGEVVGFAHEVQRDVLMEGIKPGSFEKINKLYYKTQEDEIKTLQFAACIVAAGDQSGNIAKMAKIGTGDGLLTVPLPTGKRDYNVYSMDYDPKELPLGLNTPFIIDTSGLWLRRGDIGHNLLFGHIPSIEKPIEDELSSLVQPSLVQRIPGCKNFKINHVATETYDCNTYDDSGIIGPHAYHGSLIFATGFGPLGCQHAPGIGRAITEMIIDGQYMTIDLTRFGFDRFLTDNPMVDCNVY